MGSILEWQAAQVALLPRAQGPSTHAPAQAGKPAIDPRLQRLVNAKRKPHHIPTVEQPGQLRVEVGHREGRIDTEPGRCVDGPQAVTIPDFPLKILGLAEQRGAPITSNHQPGLGL